MEEQAIVNAISSIGFPIVMCLILVWYIKSTHEKLIEAIQSLTQAVIKLETRIDTIEDQTKEVNTVERISDEHYKKA